MLTNPLTKIARFAHTNLRGVSNYYQVLGVSRTASASDIKKKYYELAKQYHPDVCKDADSSIKFNRITIAYQVLTDENKRKEYDNDNPSYNSSANGATQKQSKYDGFQYRQRSHKQRQSKEDQDQDPFMAYDEYYKKNRSWAKPRRGTDTNINLTITLQQSIKGVKKQAVYTQQQVCDACAHTEKEICFACGGKKTIFNRIKREKEQCGSCNGKGFKNECQVCHGHSIVNKDVTQSIYISKNTHNKTILRMEGLGHQGYRSSNGDLYVTVLVQESPHFKVDGNNIISEHQLDFITAILGGKTKIKTVYGEQQIQIEPGTQSGKQLRLFNLGLTSSYSKRKGDQIVTFRIKVPRNLTNKQKQLLQSLNQ